MSAAPSVADPPVTKGGSNTMSLNFGWGTSQTRTEDGSLFEYASQQMTETDDPVSFDFLRCVLPVPAGEIREAVADALDLRAFDHDKGATSYPAHVGFWEREDDRIRKIAPPVTLSYFPNPEPWEGAPTIVAPGALSIDLHHLVTTRWSDFARVSRIDACADFCAEGLFDKVHAEMDRMHYERGITRHFIGTVENGRTAYLGSRGSDVQVRWYEKGKKHLDQMSEEDRDRYRHWVRLEVEYRPPKKLRRRVLHLEPHEVFGASRFARELLEWTTGISATMIKRPALPEREPMEWVLQGFQRMQKRLAAIPRADAHRLLDGVMDAYEAHLRRKRGQSRSA